MSIYDCKVKTNKNEEIDFSTYKGKVLLIVNTASKCGFTPQYAGLEELYKSYKSKGLEILAFPCNQFGEQEPGTSEDIASFCDLQFNITFPLFDKIDVNGENSHPLYEYLKKEAPGLLGSKKIKWNFTKFLVSKDGEAIKRYSPQSKPDSLINDIESLL
ncbi:glutathione peroxidase [Halobacteriovorax marinus]|uniref:Glutathione peroxidase n=1 Tax=Halobacteriovorax marinus TaxID=97084 RepID=A0A1Y5FA45_9BACT|nr:glutathione peroxidase [Halobacteriovorax marinus]